MSHHSFDLVVIGSGPGGYVGAIRAAQLGLKTAIVEKDKRLGGTCLNVGCIPSKAMLDSSEHFAFSQQGLNEHGVDISGLKLNLPNMMERKDKIVSDLTSGVNYLMKKNKISIFNGLGKVTDLSEVTVYNLDEDKKPGSTCLNTKNIILATGSVPNGLPLLPYDGVKIISSTEALKLSEVPGHLVVVGAGAIGLEMGSVWLRLGSQVTVVEFSDKICGPMDKGTSQRTQQILQKQGMEFIFSAKVTEAKANDKGLTVNYESLKDGHIKSLEADKVLVAVGRGPFSEGLGLDEMGIERDQRGFVQVDDHFRTKYPNIYAIGDLIPGPMLAHKAEEEGVAVAEIISGQYGHVNYDTVPSVIYTWPEVASVGKTEEELKKSNIPYKSGSFPFSANGRAKAMGSTDGQVKILAHKSTDQVLGVHIVGPRASDMIAEAVVIMEFGGSSEDLARSFHAHPTLSEVMREAALNVEKIARQM